MRLLAVWLLAALLLQGCLATWGGGPRSAAGETGPGSGNVQAELGLAELAKGNLGAAEVHFQAALKDDPDDPEALIGAGLLYQHKGDTVRAREMYQRVLALQPPVSKRLVALDSLEPRPITEIAAAYLSAIDGEGGRTAAASAEEKQRAGEGLMPATVVVSGQPAETVYVDGSQSVPAKEEGNVIARFRTLRALRDQGLITGEEYARRRRANLGALLPLTALPPAAGLERPVPSSDAIAGRLRAIGRALETGVLTVSQHDRERAMILEALMPASPRVRAKPATPPNGAPEAEAASRRLTALRDEGYISAGEYGKERKALDRVLAGAVRSPAAAKDAARQATAKPARSAPRPGPPPSEAAAGGGDLPAIHLASYRSREQASRGWTQLRRAYRRLLGDLKPAVAKVDLGPGKGVYYRLKAGPLASKAAADALCRKLKRHHQYCKPAVFVAG